MPYSSVNELPEYVKKYTEKVQRQWMHVFNTVYQKTGSESRAFKAANSVLKKRLTETNAVEKNDRHDIMTMYVDSFLGNLKG